MTPAAVKKNKNRAKIVRAKFLWPFFIIKFYSKSLDRICLERDLEVLKLGNMLLAAQKIRLT